MQGKTRNELQLCCWRMLIGTSEHRSWYSRHDRQQNSSCQFSKNLTGLCWLASLLANEKGRQGCCLWYCYYCDYVHSINNVTGLTSGSVNSNNNLLLAKQVLHLYSRAATMCTFQYASFCLKKKSFSSAAGCSEFVADQTWFLPRWKSTQQCWSWHGDKTVRDGCCFHVTLLLQPLHKRLGVFAIAFGGGRWWTGKTKMMSLLLLNLPHKFIANHCCNIEMCNQL